MPRIAIIGTGLIGASVGLAMAGHGWETRGWDPSGEALETAIDRGAISNSARSIAEAGEGADIVFLAGPLHANIQALGEIDTDALVTDATSVKLPLVDVAGPHVRFVGGHPMAGREHTGPLAASPALFRGATWVLCDDGASPRDVEEMESIAGSMGANPVVMSAERHDRVVAYVSHLPHLLASALVNLVADDADAAALVSGSFRDLTRVAGAESAWWPEVLTANAESVDRAIARLIQELESLRDLAASSNMEALEGELTKARHARSAMAPPVARVRVVLQDRPGEIAAVGHALETSRVDVRDLQLRHAIHGGGGILTLLVRPGEEGALREALTAEGFETE